MVLLLIILVLFLIFGGGGGYYWSRRRVVNGQNENVGKIHKLVIDARENRVSCSLLSFGVNKS